MDLYGVSAERIASVLPVHLKTARRWKAAGQMSALGELAWQLATGELGRIHRDWAGWYLDPRTGGLKHASWIEAWTPSRLVAWRYERQLLTELQRVAHQPFQAELPLSGTWTRRPPRRLAHLLED